MRSIAVAGVVVFANIVGLVGLTLAAKQNTYLIKSREVHDSGEALSILRRFMPTKLKPDERCQKYAVMLNSITSAHLDQFKLAEIGLESTEVTNQKFRSIDIETLRQLYIEGINTFQKSHIDAALMDLVDCLSKKFRTLDAKARRFLNNEDLQETLKQHKSIMEQPLNFLVDPGARHPDLAASQLKPAVRETMLDLFNHDVDKLNSRFPGAPQTPAAPTTVLKSAAAKKFVNPTKEQASENLAKVVPGPAQVHGPTILHGNDASQLPPTAPVQIPSPVPVQTPNPAPVQTPSPAQPPVEIHEVLSGDELELLHRVIGSLHDVYNNLPVETKLGDRCQAYGKTIQADFHLLNHELVDGIVRETANKIATSGSSDEAYKPDANVRENFLFVLSSFPKDQVGHETWIDLVDCVSQWSDDDPKVREFMNSPEQTQIFEELMKAPEVAHA